MAVAAKHTFVSAKADGADATQVRPSNWNADHTVNLTGPALIGSSTSGATTATEITLGTNLSFSGNMLNAAGGRARIGPPTIANATTTTETVVAKWIIPPNFLLAGDSIRCRVNHQSAGTGTLIYRLRIGANGTTADGLAATLTTSAAQVANAQGAADFTIYFPNTTTANATGFAIQQAAVLGTPTAASANVTVVPTANIHVSITVQCSAAAANVTRGAWATVGD